MQANTASLQNLLKLSEIQKLTGLSRTTLYKLIADGDFPTGVRLTPRARRWDSAALDAWLATRTATQAGV